MELVIKSPMIPTIFRQRIFSNGQKKGYLTAIHRFGSLKGDQSFKVNFNDQIVSLVENKRKNRDRNWSILVGNNDVSKNRGSVTMTSRVADTLQDHFTQYDIEFQKTDYLLECSFMTFSGKKEAFLLNHHKEEIANLVFTYFKMPLFRKVINIHNLKQYTDDEIAFIIVVLNTVIFL